MARRRFLMNTISPKWEIRNVFSRENCFFVVWAIFMVSFVDQGLGAVFVAVCIFAATGLIIIVIKAVSDNEDAKTIVGAIVAVSLLCLVIFGSSKCSTKGSSSGSDGYQEGVWDNARVR